MDERLVWESHWKKQKGNSALDNFARFVRKNIFSRSVASAFDKFFPKQGVFAELGSGTSETSFRIDKNERNLIAVDFAFSPLLRAKEVPQIDDCVVADIHSLPFKDDSLDGVWNLGVMEHFKEDEVVLILKEFCRVLKPGSCTLLWWPPVFSSDMVIRWPLEKIGIRFFPDEPGRVSRRKAKELCLKAGFSKCKVLFPANNLFIQLLVVAEK